LVRRGTKLSFEDALRTDASLQNLNVQIAPDNAVKKGLEADARLVDMTREFNQMDLELYSFALNEIFPRLCAKAAVNPSEKVQTFAVPAQALSLRYRMSGFYNRVFFPQLCKVRALVTQPS
jgi:hypothetical protein